MEKKKIADKPIFKKWWFWVAIVAVLLIIGVATQGYTNNTDTSNNGDNNGSNSQNVGALPILNIANFKGKEGLVIFKDLVGKGYTVTAKYKNERVPARQPRLHRTIY